MDRQRLTKGNFILGGKDIVQENLGHCGTDYVKDVARDLRARVCELVEGIVQVLLDDLRADRWYS